MQHCASEANTKISGALMTAEKLDTHQGSGGELNGCGLDAPITYIDRQLLICWRKTHLTHTQLEIASTCLNRLILCGMVHTHRSLLLSLGTRVRDETSARGYVCNQLNLSSHATRMDLDSCSIFYVCDEDPESCPRPAILCEASHHSEATLSPTSQSPPRVELALGFEPITPI